MIKMTTIPYKIILIFNMKFIIYLYYYYLSTGLLKFLLPLLDLILRPNISSDSDCSGVRRGRAMEVPQ